MSQLYRTPNVVIDGVEWHCSIEERRGRARRYYRWRRQRGMWQPISIWPGHPPKLKEFGVAFAKFRLHMLQAERSQVENAVKLRRVA